MYHCERKGTVQVDGKHYCGQHDPAKMAATKKAKDDKWKAERTRDEKNRADGDALIERIGCGSLLGHDFRITGRISITFSEARAIAKRLGT